jgi:hypothetical protein
MCINCGAIFRLLIELGGLHMCDGARCFVLRDVGGNFYRCTDRENRALREVYFAAPVFFLFYLHETEKKERGCS